MSGKASNWLLFVLHITVAVIVLGAVWSNYSDRLVEHQRIAQQAEAAKVKAESREQEVEINRQLLKGLQEDDPYVIEKIARDKYDYSGSNELAPASR